MCIRDSLWSLPRVGEPCVAAAGDRLVVPVTTYSMEKNEGKTRLWLIPGDAAGAGRGGRGDAARPLTSADTSSTQPALSPDGTKLLFVRKAPRGSSSSATDAGQPPEAPQLFLMTLEGGEPERLTDLPFGVADPRWFPDGRRVAFLAPVFASDPSIEGTEKRAKKLDDDPVKVRVTEDRVYRYWDHWLTDGKVHHLFVLDLATRAMSDLTPESDRWFDLDDPSDQYRIAPDGSEIVFSACRTRPPHMLLQWGIYRVAVPARLSPRSAPRARELTGGKWAQALRPVYSPDGRWILYGMQREVDFYADKVRLVALNRSSGEHHVLTEDWDLSASGWEFAEDSSLVWLQAEAEGRTALFTLDFAAALRGTGKRAIRERVRGGTIGAPRVGGGRVFASLSSLGRPPEIVRFDPRRRVLTAITDFTGPRMRRIELAEVEEEVFPGANGEPVQMFLLRPKRSRPPSTGGAVQRGRRASEALPLVHMVHGGPHGAFLDQWHWRWNAQAFAAPGFLVAMVNFHGSTGWGQKFCASIQGSWGDAPYRDVMAATDRLIERGLVDPRRMAVAGGSYGGYLACWIASQTDRFAAIVNHAGVSDFQTQYATDLTQGRPRAMGGSLWDDIEGMDRYNPIRHAAGFRSPMLVIHGERDYRVPYDQGLEVYNVYKARGLPARLVCYPDENHWILKPRNSRHWYAEVLSWLERWLRAGSARRGASAAER
ncbi:MAG: S9 family peptidase [Candidatus Eisenbacteria bacterium]|nr:S9 family peptidase [Candidatus Eisenbacteria bacterium]